jgi:hypothetical protein
MQAVAVPPPNINKKYKRRCITMSYEPAILHINSEVGVAAAIEARRLAEKYGKDFLDCDALVEIIGVGKNNIRQLLNSDSFPTLEIGNRKVVSVIAFTLWSLSKGI